MKIFENNLPEYNVIGKEEIEGAIEVLNSGQLSGFVATPGKAHLGGRYVQKLEELFCKKFNCKYAASFNSATSALHGALVATGISEDDIQTSNFRIYPLYDSIKDSNGNYEQILIGYRVSNILSIQTDKINLGVQTVIFPPSYPLKKSFLG